MPSAQFEPASGKKQSLLGNVFNKLGSTKKKKTPAVSRQGGCGTGDLQQTKRTLFSPFSPSRVPRSAQKTGGKGVVSRMSPARLFGGGASRDGDTLEGLIPARHAVAPGPTASSIRVVVRVRPKSDRERAVGLRVQAGGGDGADALTMQSSMGEQMKFGFDKVLGADKDQRDVYEASGKGVVENCLQGFNGCLLAYGQTGSGKTYSMMGDGAQEGAGRAGASFHSRGIIQRSFEELFERIDAEKERIRGSSDQTLECSVSCSFVEIYNETICDLTNPGSGNLAIRDDPGSGVFVEGVQWHQVRSVGDVQSVLATGMANRKVAETLANDRSSRSHSVFTATIEQRIVDEMRDSSTILRSRLHLVDLAGSERQKASGAAGERLKEASNINKSLSALGHVIMTLVDVQQGRKRHVPYRDSKLTYLLQDALGGTAKTVLLATVSPVASNSSETLSTLRFADNVKRIKNKAVVNQDVAGDTEALKNEVVRLRQLLALSQEASKRGGGENGEHPVDIDAQVTGDAIGVASLASRGASQKALVAALTREERACRQVVSLQEELGALQGLVDAKESDLQRTKMMLRLKESRITGARQHDAERERLESEIELLKQKIEAHPDVKKFALENIRLRRQLDQVSADAGPGPSGAAAVSSEEFGQLRAELLEVTSRAETLLNEVQMLRAEATASKEALRTAEKRRRGSLDCPPVAAAGLGNDAQLLDELDDLRLVVERQQTKVLEYDRMCAHAAALDSAVEMLTDRCDRLGAERDEWYSAYGVSLAEIVELWSDHAEVQSNLDALQERTKEEGRRHAASNERAMQRISEAMEAAAQMNSELQKQQDRILWLEQELAEARTAAADWQAALKVAEQKCRGYEGEMAEMHSLISKYSDQVEAHAGTADALGKQLAALQAVHTAAQGEATKRERELKSTQAALASAQIDAQMTEARLKEKTKQLTFSEESESELRANIISLQDDLATARADKSIALADQSQLIDELREELAASRSNCAQLADQVGSVEALKRERAALQARVKTLEAKLVNETENTNGNSPAGPMGQEAQARKYNNVAQKLADAEETMTALHQEIVSLRGQVKSRDDSIAKLRNQMAMEVNDAAQQVQELLAAQARADRLERQLEKLLT